MIITLDNRQLHALLKPIIPLAAPESSLPVLMSVLIQRSGEYLVASATNRFVMGAQRVRVEDMPEGDFSVVVSTAHLRQVLEIFKKGRVDRPQRRLQMTVGDMAVSFEAMPLEVRTVEGVALAPVSSEQLLSVQAVCTTVTEKFPDLWSLLSAKITIERDVNAEVTVNYQQLRLFSEAFTWAGPSVSAQFFTITTGPTRSDAVMIRAGEDFTGLIMPTVSTGKPLSEVSEEWLKLASDLSESLKRRKLGTDQTGARL